MKTFTLKFVDLMPDSLEAETLYVSTRFALVSHRCACGCGEEVVTPLSPTDWHLIYDGEAISLYPSIGNWNFPCRSHYWIVQNGIRWAPKWETDISKDGFRSLVTGKKTGTARLWAKLKGKKSDS